jgi:hypothetical protein
LSIAAKCANQPKWAADHASDVTERHALLGDAMIPGACGTLHGLQEGHGLFAPALWPGLETGFPFKARKKGRTPIGSNLSQIDRRAQRAGTPVFLSSMAAHCLSLASGTSGNPP